MKQLFLRVCVGLLTAALSLPTSVSASVSEEKKLGEEFMEQARMAGGFLSDDYEISGLVREIGERLVAALGEQPFDYEFSVVRDASINAFAVPGGKVFVNAGLIARVGSEDELAGLLGHEIAHAHAHHAVRQQEKSTAANYASLLGLFLSAVSPVLGQAALAAGQGVQLKYQRDMEREADFLGIGFAAEAGYDPNAMLKLLRIIYEEQKLNPTMIPPYFLSHPLTGERMANLEAALGKLEWEAGELSSSWRLRRAAAIARASSQTRHAAVPDYERRLATASKATRPGELELIGVLMTHGEDFVLAKQYLTEAAEAGRKVDRELGRALLRTGDLDGARTRLRRALAASPKDWNVLSDIGVLEYQSGNYEASVEMLSRSLELYPYRPEVERDLGRAHEKAGRTGRGYYHFAKASELEQSRHHAVTYYRKALEALEPGDPLRATVKKRLDAVLEGAGPGSPRSMRGARPLAPRH